MSDIISQLTLSHWLPDDELDDLARAKLWLIHELDRQITQSELMLNEGRFLEMVQSWLRCEDIVGEPFIKDQFYWQHHTGAWMITLHIKGQVLPITDDRPSIEVGHFEDILNTLEMLKRAVKAGQLDERVSAISN